MVFDDLLLERQNKCEAGTVTNINHVYNDHVSSDMTKEKFQNNGLSENLRELKY